jgi:hypothetical protein
MVGGAAEGTGTGTGTTTTGTVVGDCPVLGLEGLGISSVMVVHAENRTTAAKRRSRHLMGTPRPQLEAG